METNEGFVILTDETYQRNADGSEDRIVLGYHPGKYPMWVTWESVRRPESTSTDYFWGHYTPDEDEAKADYHRRLMAYYERRKA